MGGFGSGRHGWKNKVHRCRSIDVNKMSKAGALKPECSGNWEWSEDGKKVATIGFTATHGKITLNYKYRRNMGDWKEIEQPVPILWSPCRYGGERAYFRCPGIVNGNHCRRRVVKLYAGGEYFLCRHCYNLAYASQSDDRHDRLSRRANKIRIGLGGEPGFYALINKPKGMWQRTYDRHRAEIIAAEAQSVAEFQRMYAGRLSQKDMDLLFE